MSILHGLNDPVLLGVSLLVTAVVAFGLGRSRRRADRVDQAVVDQYAIDFGTMGRKRAKPLREVRRGGDYTIFETDFLYLNQHRHLHIMEVDASLGPVGFTVGLLLDSDESRMIGTGEDWAYFDALAREVMYRPLRFKSVHVEHNGGAAA